MITKIKKAATLILAAAMAASMTALSGCNSPAADPSGDGSTGSQDGAATGEVKTVTWIGVDTAPDGMEEITKLVNEKLLKDGLNIEFVPIFLEREVRDQRIAAMFNAGEDADLIHIMENSGGGSAPMIAKGMLEPLDDLLKEYGQDLLKNLEGEWDGSTVNGKIYSIPANWKTPFPEGQLAFDKVLVDEVGITPTDLDSLYDFLIKAKEIRGKNAYFWPVTDSFENPLINLDRGNSEFPYMVEYQNELIYMKEDGIAKSWIESDAFKENAEFMRKCYENNLIHQDFLSLPYEERERYTEQGGQLNGWVTDEEREAYVKEGKLEEGERPDIEVWLNEEKPSVRIHPILNVNAVLSTSKNKAEAVQFMNWLYSDVENHTLLMYGVEGEHYQNADIEGQTIELLRNDADEKLYDFPIWQMGFIKFRMIDKNDFVNGYNPEAQLQKEIKEALTYPDNLITMPNYGFKFDTSAVSTEFTNCVATMAEAIHPIKFGIVEYEEAFPAALQKMKDAGIDKVVEEYQRQFDEWKKTTSK